MLQKITASTREASTMNWGAVDLNLLIVFDALMQERNLTRAARRLGLRQPATSHALARLRHMSNDELFVCAPEGMQPTPRHCRWPSRFMAAFALCTRP
jgi:hypothetical protein